MANNLEKFYSQFKGLDTRSNKLLQDPGSFRAGSKNFRYNFQDEIQNSQGFQRKDNSAPVFVDVFEYKYRDVNSGEAKTEILGVATDGKLYKKQNYYLHFSAHGAATSVSIYYDATANTFKAVMAGLGTVNISDAMVLKDNPTTTASLVGALNALSGVTCSIIDDDGAAVTSSSIPAHLLDCVISDTSFEDNPVYYWTEVTFPNASSVPFPLTASLYSNSDYEGISSVNLNNVIYMTDGGFPMKYDGNAVYRVGIPEARQMYDSTNSVTLTELGGITTSVISGAYRVLIGLAAGTYGYRWRFGFKDQSGAVYYGKTCQYSTLLTTTTTYQAPTITNTGFLYGHDFPVFSCKMATTSGAYTAGGTGADGAKIYTYDFVLSADVNATTILIDTNVTIHLNGYKLYATGAVTNNGSIKDCVTSRTGTHTTYSVSSGHNVKAGQCLVIPSCSSGVINSSAFFNGYYYAEVTSVAATTVTVKNITASGTYPYGGQCVNSAWVPDTTENTKQQGGYYDPPYGAFIEIQRTKIGQLSSITGDATFYVIGHGAVPYDNTATSYPDDKPDAALILEVVDIEPGNEIPRACKYLAASQGQLIQAGRTPDGTLKDDEYPTSSTTVSAATYKDLASYTEALLCDYQSVFWADILSPEGFPQDGLHEFLIETPFSDKITAIASNKDTLFAFKERSTGVLRGEFGTNDLVLEILEADCGCISHKSVQEVRGSLIWLDKVNGFYACVAGRLPENIGFPIQDYQKINSGNLNYKTAAAANFRKESLYVCSVGTTTFVFDYADNGNMKRSCWYVWDRINGVSLVATSDDKLLIWDGTYTWKMKLTGTVYDYTDHKSAIPFVLNTAFMAQGFPSVDKHYVGLWINSIQGGFTASVKQYGNFLTDIIGTQTNVEFLAESSSKKFIKAQVKAALPKLSSISFGIENSVKNEWVRLQGYEVQFSPDFSTGEPKR